MNFETIEKPTHETSHGFVGRAYLRKHHLAEMFGVSIRTVDRWMAKGHFPYSKLERAVYFEADVVRSVLSSRRTGRPVTRVETSQTA